MKYKEFLEYLENNLDGYELFLLKAFDFQTEKNGRRPSKKRWDDEKLRRAALDMWKQSMQPLYDNLRREVNSNNVEDWISYIKNNNIFETVNDGIRELSFTGDDM